MDPPAHRRREEVLWEPEKRETVPTFRSPQSNGETGEPLTQGTASLIGERGPRRTMSHSGAGVGKASWYSGHLGRPPCVGCSNQRGLHGGGGTGADLGRKGRIWRGEQRPHTATWAAEDPPASQNGLPCFIPWSRMICAWAEVLLRGVRDQTVSIHECSGHPGLLEGLDQIRQGSNPSSATCACASPRLSVRLCFSIYKMGIPSPS